MKAFSLRMYAYKLIAQTILLFINADSENSECATGSYLSHLITGQPGSSKFCRSKEVLKAFLKSPLWIALRVQEVDDGPDPS